MKTREEIKKRLIDLKEERRQLVELAGQFGSTKEKVNEWPGQEEGYKRLEELTLEEVWLERFLKYLF